MIDYNTLSDLFLHWKTKSGAGCEFTEDGIIDEARWNDVNKKILFVLKEPGEDPTKYIKCGSDSLLDLYRQWNGAKYSFNYLGRIAYGIVMPPSKSSPIKRVLSLRLLK